MILHVIFVLPLTMLMEQIAFLRACLLCTLY